MQPEGLKNYYSRFNSRRMVVNDWVPLMARWRLQDIETGEVILVAPHHIRGRVLLGQAMGLPQLDGSIFPRLFSVASSLHEIADDVFDAGNQFYGHVQNGWTWAISNDPSHHSPWGFWVVVAPSKCGTAVTAPTADAILREIKSAMETATKDNFVESLLTTTQAIITLEFLDSKLVHVTSHNLMTEAQMRRQAGDRAGGHATARTLTPEQRSRRASLGASGRAKKRALSSPSKLRAP